MFGALVKAAQQPAGSNDCGVYMLPTIEQLLMLSANDLATFSAIRHGGLCDTFKAAMMDMLGYTLAHADPGWQMLLHYAECRHERYGTD